MYWKIPIQSARYQLGTVFAIRYPTRSKDEPQAGSATNERGVLTAGLRQQS